MASRPSKRSPWSDRNFGAFWGVQALSEIGNAFSLVAVPLLVLHTTGSVRQYEIYRRVLHEELGLRPSPTIRQLVQHLLGRPGDAP